MFNLTLFQIQNAATQKMTWMYITMTHLLISSVFGVQLVLLMAQEGIFLE